MLHIAIASGDPATVKVLLDAGAPVVAFNRTTGESSLELVARLGFDGIAAAVRAHKGAGGSVHTHR